MSVPEHDLRAAAEALLTASSSSHHCITVPLSNPQLNSSMSSIPGQIPREDLVTGIRKGGRMSVVRRFFCLFVTFDLLFTSLMWLICIMLTGEEVFTALTKQVVHYSIHTSIFDIVMAASCRFTVLLLFYGLLHINHWCIIALSTAGSCAFLIGKVFVYQWMTVSQPVFHVLLVLISFVLSWGEAWFLDFRVLPQEIQAAEYLQVLAAYPESERAPLLRNYLLGIPHHDDVTESVGNFYSPMDSPQKYNEVFNTEFNEESESSITYNGTDFFSMISSDDEGDIRKYGPRGRTSSSLSQEAKYKREAQEMLEVAWMILNSSDWKLEKETPEGDLIHSKIVPRSGKVFKLTATLDFPPKLLLNELFDKVENIPNWNPTLLESRRIQVIDEHTDISYQVAKEGGGGIVTSRDFVSLRHWTRKEDSYVSAAESITHPTIPPHSKYTRGENGPTCWVMRPMPEDRNRCIFQWLLNTKLGGWVPQYVVDLALTTAMLEYVGHIRKYAKKLQDDGVLPS